MEYSMIVTIGASLFGVVLWLIKTNFSRLSNLEGKSIDENRVRSIISDKSEALHHADRESADRLDRVELRINRIDEKLDKILEELSKLKR